MAEEREVKVRRYSTIEEAQAHEGGFGGSSEEVFDGMPAEIADSLQERTPDQVIRQLHVELRDCRETVNLYFNRFGPLPEDHL